MVMTINSPKKLFIPECQDLQFQIFALIETAKQMENSMQVLFA